MSRDDLIKTNALIVKDVD
ncbi:MAG: hypothetical protein MZV63_31945 [Marinilabiliales bacterium]|nr:hypothetical protein [Marinilabiliales bacterium]